MSMWHVPIVRTTGTLGDADERKQESLGENALVVALSLTSLQT